MVFPLGDDNQDRGSFPVVNVVIIAINVFVFVVLQGMGSNLDFTYAFSTVPAEIVSGKDVVQPESEKEVRTPDGVVVVRQPGLRTTPVPVYFTLLTSMFMHGGIAHIAGNMWFLWIFGDNIENDMGRGRYAAFYLLCGILASLAHVAVSFGGAAANVPSLGASGAISGVMGAYLLYHAYRRVTVLMLRIVMDVPGYVAVGLWFLFQVASSFLGASDGVAYAAHIGGFVAGMALSPVFMIGKRKPAAYERMTQ
jgi:membrane associated rhomboid family serine protease